MPTQRSSTRRKPATSPRRRSPAINSRTGASAGRCAGARCAACGGTSGFPGCPLCPGDGLGGASCLHHALSKSSATLCRCEQVVGHARYLYGALGDSATWGIREHPSYPGTRTGESIYLGDSFAFTETRSLFHKHRDDGTYKISFYKLPGGAGWAHDFDPEHPGQPKIWPCYGDIPAPQSFPGDSCLSCQRPGRFQPSSLPVWVEARMRICNACVELHRRTEVFVDRSPEDLRAFWSAGADGHPGPVVPFFRTDAAYGDLSNWAPIRRLGGAVGPVPFRIPSCCWPDSFQTLAPREVFVYCAEAAIMLSKAALFRDIETYRALLIGHGGWASPSPAECKRLGRSVRGFNEAAWSRVILTVARAAVSARFWGGCDFQLLQTGTSLLAEANPSDPLWGVGLADSDPKMSSTAGWAGANVLGWALMDVRAEAARFIPGAHLQGPSFSPLNSRASGPILPRAGRSPSAPATATTEPLQASWPHVIPRSTAAAPAAGTRNTMPASPAPGTLLASPDAPAAAQPEVPARKRLRYACFRYLQGVCHRGDDCKFAHDDQARCPDGSACTFKAAGSCVYKVHV